MVKIAFGLVALLAWAFVITLLFDTYSISEKACYAWTATTTLGCTFSFFGVGLLGALTSNFWLSPLIGGAGNIVAEPDATVGYGILGIFLVLLLAGGFYLWRFFRNFFRRTEAPTRSASLKRVFSQDFFIVILLLVGATCGVLSYMKAAVQRNEFRPETRFVPPGVSATIDRELVASLMSAMQKHELSAEELRRQVEEAISRAQLDPVFTSKLYGSALGACQVDYLEVLEKLPQQPALDLYDANTMRGQYVLVKTPECDKYYQKMGWAKGCEVAAAADPCADLVANSASYLNSFREAQKDPQAPQCTTDADCFLSEAGMCGERLVGSKIGLNPTLDQFENSLRCSLQKRAGLCLRKDPSAYAGCRPQEQLVPVCRGSVCRAITAKEYTQPTPTPSPSPLPVLAQSFLFESDEDCYQRLFNSYETHEWQRVPAESLRTVCDSKIFKDLPEIAHVRVVRVKDQSDFSKSVRLEILKNYGRIALGKTFEMSWPPPHSKGTREIAFAAPKVGDEAIFGFYEQNGLRVDVEPRAPTLAEGQRRKVTPALIATLEANQKKFPTPKQVQQILVARKANKRASCKGYDQILGEPFLPVRDVLVEKECARDFGYFETETGSNLLRVFFEGDPTVGDINERLKTCGVKFRKMEFFFELVAPKAKTVAAVEKVIACLQEKKSMTAVMDRMPVPDGAPITL